MITRFYVCIIKLVFTKFLYIYPIDILSYVVVSYRQMYNYAYIM